MSSAGAALFCSALAQLLATRDVELASEAVCWVVLPASVELTKRWGGHGASNSSTLLDRVSSAVTSTRAWLFALGLAVACLYRAEERIIVLFPALTPLLLLSGVYPAASVAADSRFFWLPPTAKWSSGLIAAVSCVALVGSHGISLPSLTVCVVVVALLYGGYLAISRLASAGNSGAQDLGDGPGRDDAAEDLALSLALCVLPVLAVATGVRMLILHEPNGAFLVAITVGFVKAASWFFTLKATRDSSWCIATTIGTFAIASAGNASWEAQSSYLDVASRFLASVLSLGQTIDMIPKGTRAKSMLWALLALPLTPFLVTMYANGGALTTSPHRIDEHPVEALAHAAEAGFDAMLERQSRNYAAAATEYRRRYAMEPPSGFEAWYDYAVAHESPIIDEFDTIHETIAPFLQMSGRRVVEAVAEASRSSSIDLWTCNFTMHTAETRCRNPARTDKTVQKAFSRWLANMTGLLPDMEFLVNYLDEPRVMLPGAGSKSDERVRVQHLSRRPTWDAVTRNCPPGDGTAGSVPGATVDVDTLGLPFVTDTRSNVDLCQHPEYRNMHGLLMSPTTFLLVDGAVPVLSTSTLSTMGDLMFPSPGYGDDRFVYGEEGDMDWDKKRSNLYWAGSTTGGWARDDGWKTFHRHRFVALAQGLEDGVQHRYLRERDGQFERVASSQLNGSLYDVAFTSIVQCDEDMCEAERDFYRVPGRADKNAAFASKLVFDADGNGMSGRFIKLLASRSALLKQTLLREWHDERLAAWVHYLPVSQGLEELPEMVAWLTGTEQGDRRARTVADRGRAWAARAMRSADRDVYVYRLMLEVARLHDPERQAT